MTTRDASAPGRAAQAVRRLGLAAFIALSLAACGGGKNDGDTTTPPAQVEKPGTRAEAARFLTQATFGPTDADVDHLMDVGYSAWIDEQFTKTQAVSHRAAWEAADAIVKSTNPTGTIAGDGVVNSFWTQAVSGNDQLRQRTAYALSQIFVISLQDGALADNARAVANYLDMLSDKSFGNYRDLLQGVSLHPMMGLYLSSMRNQKADAKSGRVPDENYAREVMQLFSIGLQELNADGSARLTNGAPVDTYDATDIAGLAKVFTGWSWNCPEWPDNSCFFSGSANGNSDPDRSFKTMQGYPQYHSTEEKKFLGITIAPQTKASPDDSLKTALDGLYNHPNVGPFIGKQLIQRFVTSNPSPQYVQAVTAAFDNNGAGVRGDMKAVIKAVLMNPEARTSSNSAGKVREPVLRLSAVMRAFGFKSDTGFFKVGVTDNPGTQLGQTPMRSPSVFNFYRPGYVPPGTAAAAANLVVPEMQIAHETTMSGYVNFMRDNLMLGVGQYNTVVNGVTLNRRDLQPDFTGELALADKPADLLDRLNAKLMYGTMPAALKTEIQGAVEKITIPALNSGGSNQAAIDTAKRNRVNAAILLTIVSPEFLVQK
ncbi:DUF1800 domain-containing protein [Piscinibacter terrae]|uniref:DUF1800 domain-containing protein n=1 Tax=Piscinibacter terrae TaxID=2496871 RepID=A0A3N7JT68_9BURK|nr:DUF1800 domain-containing protein [Albitalea terrae]RQP24139.1 DUF1800 domain-containing protein [Albitalea terrae]